MPKGELICEGCGKYESDCECGHPETKHVEMVEATCPVCGNRFHYPKQGYRPMTCRRFECAWKHTHPEVKRK